MRLRLRLSLLLPALKQLEVKLENGKAEIQRRWQMPVPSEEAAQRDFCFAWTVATHGRAKYWRRLKLKTKKAIV